MATGREIAYNFCSNCNDVQLTDLFYKFRSAKKTHYLCHLCENKLEKEMPKGVIFTDEEVVDWIKANKKKKLIKDSINVWSK